MMLSGCVVLSLVRWIFDRECYQDHDTHLASRYVHFEDAVSAAIAQLNCMWLQRQSWCPLISSAKRKVYSQIKSTYFVSVGLYRFKT